MAFVVYQADNELEPDLQHNPSQVYSGVSPIELIGAYFQVSEVRIAALIMFRVDQLGNLSPLHLIGVVLSVSGRLDATRCKTEQV